MVGSEQQDAKVSRLSRAPGRAETLPYRIELWNTGEGDTVERVLARAFNAPLARAIFKAAQSEHPNRRITLRRGSRLIADTIE